MTSGNEKIQVVLDDNANVSVSRGGINIKVQFNANGGIDVYGNVPVTLSSRPNDIVPKATHEIGDIESAGEHKGEIYGGILPSDNKPIWFP